LFNPYYIKLEYSKENFPKSARFLDEERLNLSGQVIGFLKNQVNISMLEKSGLYEQIELRHLNDVKILTEKVFLLQKMSFIFLVSFIFSTIFLGKNKLNTISSIFSGLLITIAITIIIFLFVCFDFNWFFIKFHEILFPQGFWSFDNEATLIQLYPEEFWIDSGILLLFSVFIESLLLSLISFVAIGRLKSKKLKYIHINNNM
jgi:integral membrane protein (TIGR01906 family)